MTFPIIFKENIHKVTIKNMFYCLFLLWLVDLLGKRNVDYVLGVLISLLVPNLSSLQSGKFLK